MKRNATKQVILGICLCLTIAGSTAPDSGGSALKTGGSKDCFANAKTQFDLNQCAGTNADAADRELTQMYQSIAKRYADRPVFLERMRAAQSAWLKYRDAQIEMKFPTSASPTDETAHGSVCPMCFASYKAELIKRRTQELRHWLAGAPEGEVCAGSVKVREGLK